MTQTGIRTKILIDCEDGRELLAHLSKIRRRVALIVKRNGGDIPDGVDIRFDDNNCYGSHDVKIDPILI